MAEILNIGTKTKAESFDEDREDNRVMVSELSDFIERKDVVAMTYAALASDGTYKLHTVFRNQSVSRFTVIGFAKYAAIELERLAFESLDAD